MVKIVIVGGIVVSLGKVLDGRVEYKSRDCLERVCVCFISAGGRVCRLGGRWVVNPSGGLESKGR